MSKCANCAEDAHYVYELNRDVKTEYCRKHVPSFLRTSLLAGGLPTTEAFASTQAAALDALETPAVEEPVIEEVVVEEAPKPKARKKNAPSAEELVEAQADAPAEEPVVEEAEVVEEAPAEDTE